MIMYRWWHLDRQAPGYAEAVALAATCWPEAAGLFSENIRHDSAESIVKALASTPLPAAAPGGALIQAFDAPPRDLVAAGWYPEA
ncbi:MAG: hypothetical protein VYB54_07565 [Pseudomonadota bacterium]|nr:hypothetical protein [Pseudomonadota bacterium]